MIVWLASYPRSGNTYLRMLLYYLCGIKTFSIYNDPLFERIGASKVVGHETLPASIDELSAQDKLHFVKTHSLPMDTSPAIYIVRDGRDALVSYAKYKLAFQKKPSTMTRLKEVFRRESRFMQTLSSLIRSNEDYGGWSKNVLCWTCDRKDGFTHALRYEDLLLNPACLVKNALDALDFEIEVPLVSAEMPSFEELHRKWPDFFRKGKTEVWREEMPEYLQDLFWQKHGRAMKAFGYTRI